MASLTDMGKRRKIEPLTQQEEISFDELDKIAKTHSNYIPTSEAWIPKVKGDMPRLPVGLERLVRSACEGAITVEVPGVKDVNRFVMAWACAYLISDKAEALKRLNMVHEVWERR